MSALGTEYARRIASIWAHDTDFKALQNSMVIAKALACLMFDRFEKSSYCKDVLGSVRRERNPFWFDLRLR